MARQFEVWRTADGILVVVIQSDLLEAMTTRVVSPLMPRGRAVSQARGLNPEIVVAGEALVLMPQLAATLTLAELGEPVGSIEAQRDDVIRAIDMLLSGL